MSRVFIARDEALRRKVVVKVLDAELTHGVSAERFAREIRVAATLQQANIVPLLSAGGNGDIAYYIMPLVEGESLRARLDGGGALPIGACINIVRDITRALAYAHARGIIHRDIKPDNVLLSGGTAVVTDFGIAKAISASRTLEGAAGLTGLGMAVGTPAYMAPEQVAADANTDQRADIYALGCVAYELLAGRTPFHDRTPQQLLAAHIAERAPHVSAVRADTPPALASLVMRCLEKEPNARPQTADEVLEALDTLTSGRVDVQAAEVADAGERIPYMDRRRVLAAGIGVVLVAAVGVATLRMQPSARRLVVGTTTQVTATPEAELDAAISPDGKLIAYVGSVAGVPRVVVRQLAGGQAVVVAPADSLGEQRWPQWSHDGSALIFARHGAIYEVPALGGAVRKLFDVRAEFLGAPGNPTPAWSPDGRQIAYSDDAGLFVRRIDGGEPRRVASGNDLHSPAWSADGKFLAYVSGNRSYVNVVGNTAPSAIWAVAVDAGTPVRLTEQLHLNISPVWAEGGRRLLYVSNAGGGRDIYQLSLGRDGAPSGTPQRLTAGLEPFTISVSADGRRVGYTVLRSRANIWSAPFSLSDTTPFSAARPLTAENQRVEGVAVSPNGATLAYDANRSGNSDIYRIPAAGGEAVQLTTDKADDFEPEWSPDGKRIAFYSTRTGTRDIYVMDADGANVEHVTALPGQERFPTWSPNGMRLAFASTANGAEDVYVTTRAASGVWAAPTRLTTTGAGFPRWSPRGDLIAATSHGTLVLIPAAGGAPRTVYRGPERAVFGAWGVDPTVVYLATMSRDRVQSSYWAGPINGGAPRLLLRLPEGTRSGVTFATDGKRLYFTIESADMDVFTLDLVGG